MSEWSDKVDRFMIGFEVELKKLTAQQKKDMAAINQKLAELERKIATLNRK